MAFTEGIEGEFAVGDDFDGVALFFEDAEGELYALDLVSGAIYRMVPSDGYAVTASDHSWQAARFGRTWALMTWTAADPSTGSSTSSYARNSLGSSAPQYRIVGS